MKDIEVMGPGHLGWPRPYAALAHFWPLVGAVANYLGLAIPPVPSHRPFGPNFLLDCLPSYLLPLRKS